VPERKLSRSRSGRIHLRPLGLHQANSSCQVCWRKTRWQWVSPTLSKPDIGKGRFQAVQFIGRERADIHQGPESLTPLETEYISADHLPSLVFRLQLCGGPYIPIRGMWPGNIRHAFYRVPKSTSRVLGRGTEARSSVASPTPCRAAIAREGYPCARCAAIAEASTSLFFSAVRAISPSPGHSAGRPGRRNWNRKCNNTLDLLLRRSGLRP
jgi:hypothetical protein